MAARRFLPLLLVLLFLPAAAAALSRAWPGPDGSPLPEPCRLPRVVGGCQDSVPRWWFNGTAGVCQSFLFTGCQGNANNFLSERECRESCRGAPPPPQYRTAQPDAIYTEHCTAPRVTGPCRASFPRWYYVPVNQSCRQFIYGGCRGNKNNYQNEEECLNRCHPKTDTGADFGGVFLSVKGLALGLLLAIPAAVLVGFVVDVALKTCRKKPELPVPGMPWNPRDDTEYLMSNAYTL